MYYQKNTDGCLHTIIYQIIDNYKNEQAVPMDKNM